MGPVRRRQCWGGRGWLFLCVCVRGVGGVSCFPPLPCSIPPPPWLLAPFLLVHALAVLPLAAALGGLVFHTWWCCFCWRWGALGAGVWLSLCSCPRAFFSRFFFPSSPFIPFCFSAASLIACMYSVALHTLLRLRRLACVSMGITFCSLWGHAGYTFLVTFVGAVIVVPFSLVWRGVACNILVLVLAHGCSSWWCVACSVPRSCFACSGMYARIRAAYLLLPM